MALSQLKRIGSNAPHPLLSALCYMPIACKLSVCQILIKSSRLKVISLLCLILISEV